MKKIFIVALLFLTLETSAPLFAKSVLFSLVTIFVYPEDTNNFVQVQGVNQMTKEECETQVFLLSDKKDSSLPFGRSTKWETVGQESTLKDGEIVVNSVEQKDINLSFLCVPTGWSIKK